MIGEYLKSSILTDIRRFREAHENFVKELEKCKTEKLKSEYDRVQAVLEQFEAEKGRS